MANVFDEYIPTKEGNVFDEYIPTKKPVVQPTRQLQPPPQVQVTQPQQQVSSTPPNIASQQEGVLGRARNAIAKTLSTLNAPSGDYAELPQSFVPPKQPQTMSPATARAIENFNADTPQERQLSIGMPTRQPKQSWLEKVLPSSIHPQARGLTPEDKNKAANIMALSEATNLPPSFIEQNYDKVTAKIGLRGVPTQSEMMGYFIKLGIAAGMATNPITTVKGIASYMAVKEAENLAESKRQGIKYKPLEGHEFREALGDLKEPYNTLADIAEFALGVGGATGIGKGLDAIRNSDWFRTATMKERALVVQSIKSMRDAGMTEGQIAREQWKDPSKREALLKKWVYGPEEERIVPTEKPKVKEKPVETPEKPIVEPTPEVEPQVKVEPKVEPEKATEAKPTEEPLKPATKVWNKETHKWDVVEGEVGDTHHDIHEAEDIPKNVGEDGFVNDKGEFVERPEATEKAKESGIPIKGKELSSTDLIEAKKEPWQMTKQEWQKVSIPSEISEEPTDIVKDGLRIMGIPENQMRSRNLSSASIVARNSYNITNEEPWIQKIKKYQGLGISTYQGWARRALIEQAISEGKIVPPEVLADYPDLKPEVRATPQEWADVGVTDPREVAKLESQNVTPSDVSEADKIMKKPIEVGEGESKERKTGIERDIDKQVEAINFEVDLANKNKEYAPTAIKKIKKLSEDAQDNYDRGLEQYGSVTAEASSALDKLKKPKTQAIPPESVKAEEPPVEKVTPKMEVKTTPSGERPDFRIMSTEQPDVKKYKTVADVADAFKRGELNYGNSQYSEITDKAKAEFDESIANLPKGSKITSTKDTIKITEPSIRDKEGELTKGRVHTFELVKPTIQDINKQEGVELLGWTTSRANREALATRKVIKDLFKEDEAFAENPVFTVNKGGTSKEPEYWLEFKIDKRKYEFKPSAISNELLDKIKSGEIKDGQTIQVSRGYIENKNPEVFLVDTKKAPEPTQLYSGIPVDAILEEAKPSLITAANTLKTSGNKATKDIVEHLKDTKEIVEPYDPHTFGDRIPERQETGIPKEEPTLLKPKKDMFPMQEKLSPNTALRSFFGLRDNPVIDKQKSDMTLHENVKNSGRFVMEALKDIPDDMDDIVKEVKPLFDKNRGLLSDFEKIQDEKNTLKRRLSKIPRHNEYERLKDEIKDLSKEMTKQQKVVESLTGADAVEKFAKMKEDRLKKYEQKIEQLKTERGKIWRKGYHAGVERIKKRTLEQERNLALAQQRRIDAKIMRRSEKAAVIEENFQRVKDYNELIQKIKEAESREKQLYPQFETMGKEFDAQLKGIAEKYPDARVYLEASGELPEGVELSPKEQKAADQLRKYQEATRDKLESLGIPVIKGKGYMTHLWQQLLDDDTAGNAISKKFKEKPTLLRFMPRVPNSRPWIPSAHGAMEAYVPVAEYKIATQPFLDRWRPFVDTLQNPRLRKFMEDWMDKNKARQDIGTFDKIVNTAVGFEYARLIGLSLSVGMKHLLKLGGTPSEYGYLASLKAIPQVVQVPMQAAVEFASMKFPEFRKLAEKIGIKGEANQLRLFRHYVTQSDILRSLTEIPGLEEMDRSAFGFTAQGAKAIAKTANVFLKNILSQPIKTVEALDNGVSVFSGAVAGHARNIDPAIIERRIWEAIFDVNFRAGVDQPLYQKQAVVRAFTMFQMTPIKLAEQKAKWIHDAIALTKDPETGQWTVGKKDAFGTHGAAKLLRFLILVGAAETIARENDTSILEMFFHVPFLSGVLEATKEGYRAKPVGEWKPTASPLIQYGYEASKKGLYPAIKEHLKEGLMSYAKIGKAEEGSYPEMYDSASKYLLGLKKLQTPFEASARDILSNKPYFEPEDKEKSDLKRTMERRLREGDKDVYRKFDELVEKKRLTEDDVSDIIDRSQIPPTEKLVERMKKAKDIGEVITKNELTEDEKAAAYPAFLDKIDKLTDDEKMELYPKFKKKAQKNWSKMDKDEKEWYTSVLQQLRTTQQED